jgi:hypothetical protein
MEALYRVQFRHDAPVAAARPGGTLPWWLMVAIGRTRLATAGEIAAARDKIASLRGTTADFDIAVWGELDTAGRVAARLPGYRAAGATWWLESPGSGPGWMDAVRHRLQRGSEA